ncbi:hypothetical protein Pcinc_026987 [Petrolisthes cinctipes]|uniref:Transmembrane protein n=1 Tax=Petrolisthes cinctipes TaxID=88211 RepID=A0AAE1F5N6_PETCI|nr:hypothetical protein Pcinc_026987 [Petrolisthes cinctipes]
MGVWVYGKGWVVLVGVPGTLVVVVVMMGRGVGRGVVVSKKRCRWGSEVWRGRIGDVLVVVVVVVVVGPKI